LREFNAIWVGKTQRWKDLENIAESRVFSKALKTWKKFVIRGKIIIVAYLLQCIWIAIADIYGKNKKLHIRFF